LAGLRDLAHAYPEVRFYAISRDTPAESAELVKKLAKDGKGSAGLIFVSDLKSQTIDRYAIRDPEYSGQKIDGVPRPSVFVLDKTGRIRWKKIETDYRERPTNEEVAAALQMDATRADDLPTCGHAAALACHLPNSYKYSTNDITAPSYPCTFGFADSIT
jgi:peroxiredoxin